MNCGLCLSMILGWEFPIQPTNVSSKNYWSWMIVENLVCIKQKYTANSQDERAEEHERKVVVTIREKFVSISFMMSSESSLYTRQGFWRIRFSG
ncbi:unnamed protein product [Prunus brigantina]